MIIKSFKTYLIFCLLGLSLISAQNTKIDRSLLNSLKVTTSHESNPLKLCQTYNRIADEYFITYDLDSVKYYSEKAIKIAKVEGYKTEEGTAYKNIARTSSFNFDKRGYLTLKRDYHENISSAIQIFSGINDKKNLAECYYFLAKYYLSYHNSALFLETNNKAIELFKSLNDNLGVSRCYVAYAKVLSIQKKYEEAERLFRISEAVF